MAHKRKRIFDGLYAQLEETDGNVVLFSARGEPSVIFEITNPVQQLCTDAQQYMLFHDVLSNILQTIGEGYALQKQDILCRQAYHHDVPDDAEFLTRSYFRYFEGRELPRRLRRTSSSSTTRRDGSISIPRYQRRMIF